MAIESWRLSKVLEGLLRKLDASEQNRYQSKFNWFGKKIREALEKVGLKFIDVEGQHFEPGIAATPLNIGEFGDGDALIVDRMIEPIITGPEGLVRMGTVTLRKWQP